MANYLYALVRKGDPRIIETTQRVCVGVGDNDEEIFQEVTNWSFLGEWCIPTDAPLDLRIGDVSVKEGEFVLCMYASTAPALAASNIPFHI